MNELEILKAGGIGIMPTDTIYGVVAQASSKEAVERIYAAKGRDENKPFIILISDIKDLKKFEIELTKKQKKFLQSVWSGPVSIILRCAYKRFEYLHRGGKSLAFRLPDHPEIIDFLKKTGPLVAPSANPQGKIPAKTIEEAKKYFGKKMDFYMDGGFMDGRPSKIISLTGPEPVIIRV